MKPSPEVQMMHAQPHMQLAARGNTTALGDAPQIARRLLAANEEYAASNNPALSITDRRQARQRARLALEELLKAQPNNAKALSLLGRVELDGERLTEARALFEKSLEIEPENAQCLANLGYWALKGQNPAMAEHCFMQALIHDRQSSAAFCGMAHAKRLQGEFAVAYLHYRKLLDLGLAWPSVYSGMLQCAKNLEIKQADASLARDAIRLLSVETLPHQDLSSFVAALVRQQYDLDNPNAEVFLDAAATDELLLLGLERTLLTDPAVEGLVTLLRSHLLQTTMAEKTLEEQHQRLAIGLGLYAARTGYALLQTETEATLIDALHSDMQTLLAKPAPLAMPAGELAGSVIISAMYGALFHQHFAPELGRFELAAWPAGLQQLVSVSYYQLAEDEAYKQLFAEKEAELAMAPADLSFAWPAWRNLNLMTERLLREELAQSLNIHLDLEQADPVRVMVLGCGSGQRALEIARFYTDVEVIATDETLANLAHGARRAREEGLDNIVFWPYSLVGKFINDGHRALFVELDQIPSALQSDGTVAALVDQALAEGGLIHFNTGSMAVSPVDQQIQALVRNHRLQPTTESVRRLRRMVLNNRADARWSEITNAADFYGTAGCRQRWFYPESPEQTHALLSHLANEVKWRLVKARDSDGQELTPAPVQAQLVAERHGSSVQSLAGQALSLYFQKR
ncbi:class I SAM-dependent methyltransferase [Hydrocarboniclastica marina]|nr:class I SAM-dependent methyltransferase [Hydrocarboniclastica marina]